MICYKCVLWQRIVDSVLIFCGKRPSIIARCEWLLVLFSNVELLARFAEFTGKFYCKFAMTCGMSSL